LRFDFEITSVDRRNVRERRPKDIGKWSGGGRAWIVPVALQNSLAPLSYSFPFLLLNSKSCAYTTTTHVMFSFVHGVLDHNQEKLKSFFGKSKVFLFSQKQTRILFICRLLSSRVFSSSNWNWIVAMHSREVTYHTRNLTLFKWSTVSHSDLSSDAVAKIRDYFETTWQ
jgi:hypothetical protein